MYIQSTLKCVWFSNQTIDVQLSKAFTCLTNGIAEKICLKCHSLLSQDMFDKQ